MQQFFDAFLNFLSTYFNIPFALLTAFLALFGISGCAELEKNQMAQSAKVVAEKVGDAVAAGIEEGIRDVQATASVQGINPGYDFKMKVTVGTVVDVDGHIGLSGVAGQMSINAASGRDTLPAPKTEPTTTPPVE